MYGSASRRAGCKPAPTITRLRDWHEATPLPDRGSDAEPEELYAIVRGCAVGRTRGVWYSAGMDSYSSDKQDAVMGRLIVGRQSQALREALWRLVREAKGGDPLAPVTVVGPSSYANLSLRQELGAGGFANVRFIVLPVLAELLGGAAMARSGRRPLTSVLERVWLREVMAGATGPLAPVRDHAATQASVRASFVELRQVGEDVLAGLEARGDLRRELVTLYREFRRRVSGDWYDAEDLAEAAAGAVRGDDAPALAELGVILFYLPRNVSPAELGLIEALAERRLCGVVLGTTGDGGADASVEALACSLGATLGARVAVGPGQIDEGQRQGGVRLHVAPTAHEEVRWAIRRIAQEARERRTPFHRMAILYRVDSPYASLVRDELRMAGLPVAGPDRQTLADSAAGRTLTGLLSMPGGEFRRADVMEWLTSCPVRPPGAAGGGFSPSRWDSLTRAAGVVRGPEQWRERLGHHATRLKEEATGRLDAGEITEARAERMGAEAATARDVLGFIERLASDVEPPEDGSRWEKFRAWAEELLERYLVSDSRLPEAEVVALERVTRTLRELSAADSVGRGCTLEEFRQSVADSLRGTVGHLGVTGQGVFVSSIAAASGMSFDVVWVVGMVEGGMPPAIRPDPLLPETEWQAAGGASRVARRIAGERYDYLSALATARRRELSYPAANAASQRQAYPSRWFLEQATLLEGEAVRASGLARLGEREWLSIDRSPEEALTRTPEAALSDAFDYHLSRLLAWRRDGRWLGDHPFAGDGTLARAVELGRSRNVRWLTDYDGNLSSAVGDARFARNLGQSPVSPTSLENWATCPFRYFLGHVLRLSALEQAEEDESISALDRGSLIHSILERFIRDVVRDGGLPAADEAWRPDQRRRLMEIAEEEFGSAESRGVTGKSLLWGLAKRDILADLDTFLEEDEKLRASQGTGMIQVEATFGFGGDTPEVRDAETGLSFRGRIDRMDLSADGRSALVIDYKTGSARPYRALDDDPIDAGKRLQLGVYSLAARALAPGADVRAAYWFTTNGGEFRRAPSAAIRPGGSGRWGSGFREGLRTIVSGIGAGVFPANPGPPGRYGPSNCAYCDFDSLCATRRVELWERKRSDAGLASYLALSDRE